MTAGESAKQIEPERTVKRFDELVPDEQIERIIKRYALGAEIWWNREYVNTQVPAQTPDGKIVAINLPAMQIHLGMKGYLLGPENYVWWYITIDAFPTPEKIERNIKEALEGMRMNKSAQLNGSTGKK